MSGPQDAGRVTSSPGSHPTGHAASGVDGASRVDPSRGFLLKRWEVSAGRWGAGSQLAPTRGKALADAWRSDAFNGYTFGEFLKFARCRRDRITPPRWGDRITVLGKPAFFLGNNRQYVQFVYPGGEFSLNAHPYDVLPVEYRPDTYRDRDSDRSGEAGETGTGLVEGESAGRNGIAQS